MKKLIGILVLIFLFAAVLGCGSDHKPLPANQYMAFLTQVTSTTYQINTMKYDGTSVAAVGTPDLFEFARLSPDGKKVVFEYYDNAAGRSDIGIMNVDGSGRTPLVTTGTIWYPQFTPDGSKIIYESYPGGTGATWDIYEMNVDGTGSTNLTKQNGYSYLWATVSPDGKTIAAEAANAASSTSGLVTLKIDGSGTTFIKSGGGEFWWPSFSADGTKIFMSSYVSGYNVSVVDVGGTNFTNLATSGYDTSPIVVGGKVLFQSSRDSATHNWEDPGTEIYNMNPDGTGATRLTNNTVYDGFIGYEIE